MQGLVISGGGADAFGSEPWILRLKKVLQEEHARGQRILGVCFGHQVLAEALGGRAGAPHMSCTPCGATHSYLGQRRHRNLPAFALKEDESPPLLGPVGRLVGCAYL